MSPVSTRHKPQIPPVVQKSVPKPLIRAATYLVPSIPVEYFEAVLQYLERRLDCEYALRYESRWEAPIANRRNPFNEDEIDIGKPS